MQMQCRKRTRTIVERVMYQRLRNPHMLVEFLLEQSLQEVSNCRCYSGTARGEATGSDTTVLAMRWRYAHCENCILREQLVECFIL